MLRCNSVELYLIGSDSNKRLTPFAADLAEDPQSVSVETSISSQETIGRWLLPNTWGGEVPSSTWTFSINYEVANAAGVQINATATVSVGSKSFSAATEPGSSFLAQGSGSLTFDIEVESFTTSGSSTLKLNSLLKQSCSVCLRLMPNWNFSGAVRTKHLPLKQPFL